ncbi:hypothetical protein BDV29DRAFT_45499 [Aspergillus leporis]|uniref:Arrestin-like N-terminal domain-containing protein n=1 Tax=Aspergillus leporis TaxID=41062 RepID=A0A5N5XBX5_9EURO|nr:hypothetical protein BDV29DRAFT_45499 [Aspergillus leporis]
MPVTVQLDNHLACYSGNEPLRGRVIFICPSPTEIQDVRVTFSGRAKAKLQKVKGSVAPSATYRSKCILFSQERILACANGELPRDTYEWPFEFVFPSHAQSHAKWPEKLPFRSDENHPLPPTFSAEVEDSLRRLECVIDYRIQAQVFKPQKALLGKKSALFNEVIRLDFLPSTAQFEPMDLTGNLFRHEQEQMFTVRSLLLLPENRGRNLKVQEKFQSWLSPKHLPRFDFRVSFEYPTRVIQASPLTCLLNIAPFEEGSSVTTFPEIVLQSASIAVLSRTAARAAPSLMGAISGEVDERIEILSKTSIGMPVLGQADLSKVFGPLVFKHSDVSFDTFNISRTYRLCAIFIFECAGKTLEFNAPELPFKIVATVDDPNERGISELADTTSTSLSSSTEPDDDDAPPAYSIESPVVASPVEKAK